MDNYQDTNHNKRGITIASISNDIFKLVSGTALAQILILLSTPIITRLYTPEAFGLLALYTSIVNIFLIVVCLRYEPAIVLPKSDREAANILGLSIISGACFSLLFLVTIQRVDQPILNLLNAPKLDRYIWLVAPAIFAGGLFSSLNYWISRDKQFGSMAIVKIIGSLVVICIQLTAGFLGYANGSNLIIANLIGSFISVIVLSTLVWRKDRHLLKSINFRCIWVCLQRYKKFPLIDTSSMLLNIISWQLPVFLLTAFFSSKVAGFYSLGFMAIQSPMALIGGSISQVFFQRAVMAKNDNNLSFVVKGLFEVLLGFSMFPMLLLSIIGKDLFTIFFGEAWAEAGFYLQILSIWSIIWFVSGPLFTLVSVLEKQEYGLIFNIANMSTRLLSIMVGVHFNSPIISIGLFALSGLFVYGYLCLWIINESGIPHIEIMRIFGYNLIHFLPAGFVLITLKVIGINPMIQISMAAILLIIYFAITVNGTLSKLKNI